jgi:hypothetical protein
MSKEIKDKQVELDGIVIPYCEEGGVEWYPIRYVTEKFLLKGSPQLHKNEEYKQFIKRHTIDYTFKGTTPQETYCMNRDGWNKYLNECKLNKNKTIDKIKRYNIFCDYFECDNKYEIVEDVEYDDYMRDCINSVLENNKNIEFKKCLKCGREFPLHINFFPKDDRVAIGFTGSCNMCKPSAYPIAHVDKHARRVYKLYGNDAYLLYMNDVSKFIEKYNDKDGYEELCLHTNTNPFMKVTEKEVLLKIIKQDYKDKVIKVSDLNVEFVLTKYKIRVKYNNLTNNEINEYCSDNDCKIRPWLYTCYKTEQLSLQEGFDIFRRYIFENKIKIDDILNYSQYETLLKNSKLNQFSGVNFSHKITSLEFIVKYYNNEYAGYKFKLKSANYYNNKENRIFDMKYLVEKDLKIEILKIPLYITKTMLHERYSPLYLVLNKTCYDGNLFKWIDECYPNKFIELDFNINPYRNLFDSFEEAQVDRILRTKCNNVIYNIRNSDNEVTVLDMKPDWLIISDKGTILVEYFGLYTHGGKEYKERLEIYKNKMDKKYTKYGELLKLGYKHLYIYPDDLKKDFEGLHKKLKVIQ